MNRICSNKRISETQIRYRSHIESDPCAPNSQESRIVQYHLLQSMVNMPDLLTCGPVVFETMRIFHSGTCWIADLEAIVEEQAPDGE